MRTGLIAIGLLLVLGGVYYFQTDESEEASNTPSVTPVPESGTDGTSDASGADDDDASGAETDSDVDVEQDTDIGVGVDTGDDNADGVTVVTYDGTSFSPGQVTVSVGDTVRFESTGGAEMWVASDVHPTHREYPVKTESDCLGSAFDQCTAGGTFEFTFTAPGTHEYHNHIRAQHGGTVVVQ